MSKYPQCYIHYGLMYYFARKISDRRRGVNCYVVKDIFSRLTYMHGLLISPVNGWAHIIIYFSTFAKRITHLLKSSKYLFGICSQRVSNLWFEENFQTKDTRLLNLYN